MKRVLITFVAGSLLAAGAVVLRSYWVAKSFEGDRPQMLAPGTPAE